MLLISPKNIRSLWGGNNPIFIIKNKELFAVKAKSFILFKMKKQIIILGAGLSGLTIAYLLKKKGYGVCVLEARDRLGGRIYTKLSANNTPVVSTYGE